MRRLSAGQRASIERMCRDGEKYAYIAASLKVSVQTVCRVAALAGLARGKGNRPRAPCSPP